MGNRFSKVITFDPNYLFTSTQMAVVIYLVVIVFNVIFWIVDSVRGKPVSPKHTSPPLHIVGIGLILGFIVALPISFVSYAVLLWLNPYLFILRVPVKIIIFLGTCLLVMVAMDLMVVLIEQIGRKPKPMSKEKELPT